MRVAFLIHEIGRSGGAQTILRYARTLEGAELVVTGPARDLPAERDGVPVRRLADARGESWDCAIATWWTTAGHLWEVDARARITFLQSIESRFYPEAHFAERFAAEQVLTLPVSYVVVAPWMRDVLAALRPDAPCVVVRNGIDKGVFAPREADPPGAADAAPPGAAAPRPLRVLVEGQPSQWFKGVHDALAATRAMSEPADVTVVAGDPSATGGVEDARIVGGFDPAGMAALYAEHDVLLKLSRVESLGLAPIEAFHVGVPAVVAPYTGHEEYLEHGRNGLVAGYDDVPGTARALDALARDRDRLGSLSEGALATAAAWPSADAAAGEFAAAVSELAGGPLPDPAASLAEVQRAQRRWLELGREHIRQYEWAQRELRGAVAWHEDAYAEAKEHVEDLNERLRIAHEEGVALTEQLEQLRSSRAYRAAVSLRKLKPGGGE